MAITLESLQHGQSSAPPRILLYGVPGIGKSFFASQAPNPVFIMTEKGKGRLNFTNFPVAKCWEDVEGAVNALLNESHNFNTVVLDTVDWLERLIFEKVCRKEGKSSIEEFSYGKGYVQALTYWSTLFEMMDALNEEKEMGVILIGHSAVKLFNNPEGENYDKYQLNVHQKAAAMLIEWPDCVLFANNEVRIKVPEEAAKSKKEVKGKPVRMSEQPRVLYTEERPAFWAKNRYCLPFKMELDWPTFEGAMAAGIEQQQEILEEMKQESKKPEGGKERSKKTEKTTANTAA